MKYFSLPTEIDLSKCILWQYQNATRLQRLVGLFQDGTELSSTDMWKKTFNAFNLDKEILTTDDDYDVRVYGLFEISNLFGLKRPSYLGTDGQYHSVSVNAWRRYVKGMIWLMDSDGSASDINTWLKIIFPDVTQCYVNDNLDMTIDYTFIPMPGTTTDSYQMIHIEGFLPHPAGVLVGEDMYPVDNIFGFEGYHAEWWHAYTSTYPISYAVGDVVIYPSNGTTPRYCYNCITANSDTAWTASHWNKIVAWVAGTSYTAGSSFVLHNPETDASSVYVYKCKTTNSDTEFDYAKWTRILTNVGQLNASRFGVELHEVSYQHEVFFAYEQLNNVIIAAKAVDISSGIQNINLIRDSDTPETLIQTYNNLVDASTVYDFPTSHLDTSKAFNYTRIYINNLINVVKNNRRK